MLTKNELAWYDLRPYDGTAWCYHCPQLGQNCSTSPFCPLINADMEDALEFSERVAAKLANVHFGTEDCPFCSNHINVNEYCGECKTASTDKRCLACRIKYARLKVEEEMDGK